MLIRLTIKLTKLELLIAVSVMIMTSYTCSLFVL